MMMTTVANRRAQHKVRVGGDSGGLQQQTSRNELEMNGVEIEDV